MQSRKQELAGRLLSVLYVAPRRAWQGTQRMQHTSTSFYETAVEEWASQPVEVLSLYQMLNYGRDASTNPDKILKSARFVQREIPKRLARRLLDLQLLPYIVVTNPHIKRVYDSYYQSFDALRQLPPVHTLEDNAQFSQILRKQLDQHAPMLDSLATGLREIKGKELVGRCLQLDAFFDSMLRSRISRRVIAEQHLQLSDKRPGYIGIIGTDLDVADAVDLAAQKTRQVCMETYGAAPEVVVSGDLGAKVPYIPHHLDYMLYELLKNAARAVVEHAHLKQASYADAAAGGNTSSSSHHSHGPASRQPHMLMHGQHGKGRRRGSQSGLPPIHVRICAGQHPPDLTIKISDQGGGIPLQNTDRVWSYGFTTVGNIPAGYQLPQSGKLSGETSAGEGLGEPTHGYSVGGPSGASISPDHVLHGSLPSGQAAAGSHESFWHTYSPATVASGPRAPQPLVASLGELQGVGQLDNSAGSSHAEGLGMMGQWEGGGGVGGGPARFRLAGLGFGLPLSRLYARYFGGDLTLQVVPGYGTDCYLTIKRLEDNDWCETMDDPAQV